MLIFWFLLNVVKETKKQEGHGHISPFLTLFIVSTFLVHFPKPLLPTRPIRVIICYYLDILLSTLPPVCCSDLIGPFLFPRSLLCFWGPVCGQISKPWWILLIISNVMLFCLENMPTTIIIILCLLKTLILLLWFCSQKLVSAIVLFTSFIHSNSYHFYAIQYCDFTVYLSIIMVPSWKCQCASLFLSLLCLSMFFSLPFPIPFKCICEANLYIHFQLGKVGFQHNR